MTRPGSRSVPRLSRAVLVAGAVVGSVALGGCGAGQVAQTAYQANASGGATVNANGIAIRDAQVAYSGAVGRANVYSIGGTAPVEMHILNQSTQDDRLVSASSPIAASVRISGQSDLPAGVGMVVGGGTGTGGQSAAGASEAPAKEPIESGLPGGPTQTNPASPPSAAEEPSDTAPTGSGTASGEAPAVDLPSVPPNSEIDPSTRNAEVVLTGLRDNIRAGLSYEIDLTFERAGVVRVILPVAYPEQPREPAEKG